MLKSILSTLIIFCVLTSVQVQAQEKFSKEEKAIMQVIENESKYFWARDFKQWKKTWVHESYVVWTAASQDGVRRYEGWDSWLAEVEGLFSGSPEPIPYEGDVKKYDYQFRIYDKGAWVSFTQENLGTKTIETRIMEKKGGKWKIAMVQLIFDVNQSVDTVENSSDN